METSENLDQIAAALAAAQGEMTNAALNRENPHFRSRYADLAAIRDTVVPALSRHGIALSQILAGDELLTVLVHSSGQRIVSRYPLPRTDKAQAFGSALTYGRRYSLAAIAGISADEDDDGNAAESEAKARSATNGNGKPKREAPPPPPSEGEIEKRRRYSGLWTALKEATDAEMLRSLWDADREFVETLPQAGQKKLCDLFNARLDELEPAEEEPHEARLMRAG